MSIRTQQDAERHLLPNGRFGGWKPDSPKYGDESIKADWYIEKRLARPRRAAKNPKLNPLFYNWLKDQGDLGSCTGHSGTACLESLILDAAHKEGQDITSKWGTNWALSALAAYYQGRVIEKTVFFDSGCENRDVVDGIRRLGVPTEESWPYNVRKFRNAPTATAMKTAPWHRYGVSTYRCDAPGGSREQTVTNMVNALANGFPLNGGFACPVNWGDSDNTGLIPLPDKDGLEGGHAVPHFEADTDEKIFWGPNSWGGKWGRKAPEGTRFNASKGWIGVPFQYYLDGNADDAWMCTLDVK